MKRWIHASKDDYLDPDLYVIKIWYEVDPGRDMGAPVASEEVFEVYAMSPQDAKEQVMRQWSGPIDRIEIVDINPENTDEDLLYEDAAVQGSNEVIANSTSDQPTFQEWLEREYYEGFDPSGLSDEEYYELEDAYYESIGSPSSGMTKKQFDRWWDTLSRSEMDKAADIMEDMGLLTIKSDNWTDSERKEIKDTFESKYR